MKTPKKLSLSSLTILLASILLISTARSGHSATGAPDMQILDRALMAIEEGYLEPKRINPPKMFWAALNRVQKRIPEILATSDGNAVTLTVGLASKRFPLDAIREVADLKRSLHEVLSFAFESYHGDIETAEILYAAMDGMLEELDPHSNFMPPKAFDEFRVSTRGNFGGLGIVISIKDGLLTVIAPIEGTPAANAGIKAGDRIAQIDDESTINMSLPDAVNKLRGDVGTKVMIIVERANQAPRKVVLARAVINIDSIKEQVFIENGKRIAFIKVKNFQENTAEDLNATLKKLHAGGKIDGLVLDLRNNPGGLLSVAIDVAKEFISGGTIVTTEERGGKVTERADAAAAAPEPTYPIVALINEGSASASEIVAGALQSNNRALILGRTSFGKGSVQQVFNLGEKSALKLTIAQYKPAGTMSIQLLGVTPDISLDPVTIDKDSMNLVEDETQSEKDLEKPLDNGLVVKDAVKEKPKASIRFFQPKEDEKAEDEKSRREYANAIDIRDDFAAKISLKLVAATSASVRQAMLAPMAMPIAESVREQQAIIDGALKALGIDWSKGQATQGAPKLSVVYDIMRGTSVIKRAKAGDKISIRMTVTNTGTAPFSQLIGVAQSDYPFLANKEFPFGSLPAGATRSFSTKVELPEAILTQDLVMKLTFSEGFGRIPPPMEMTIPVEEQPAPLFAFGIQFPSRGKKLPIGTSMPMIIDIQNIGAGKSSSETVATISNDCGEKIFIEKGRLKIGTIEPGAKKPAPFRFHITEEVGTEKCALKLGIMDIKRYTFLNDKITLSPANGKISPDTDKTYQPPIVTLTPATTTTKLAEIEITGSIKDTDAIRDYYVFVGDKKIAYVPNAAKGNAMEFRVKVPLEPGPNQILISARDEYELTGRKAFVVSRLGGEKKGEKGLPALGIPEDLLP